MRKIALLAFCLAALAAAGCQSPIMVEDKITGTWVTDIPGPVPGVQGIILSRNGAAGSLNQATLQYTGFAFDGRTLTLDGKSLGNGREIAFTDSYEVLSLDDKTLTVKNGEQVITYRKLTAAAQFNPDDTPLKN